MREKLSKRDHRRLRTRKLSRAFSEHVVRPEEFPNDGSRDTGFMTRQDGERTCTIRLAFRKWKIVAIQTVENPAASQQSIGRGAASIFPLLIRVLLQWRY